MSYRIGSEVHRGPDAVVQSDSEGSAMARQSFDRVEFDHTVVGLIGDRIVRVDSSLVDSPLGRGENPSVHLVYFPW